MSFEISSYIEIVCPDLFVLVFLKIPTIIILVLSQMLELKITHFYKKKLIFSGSLDRMRKLVDEIRKIVLK
jgi:hypothetical protein